MLRTLLEFLVLSGLVFGGLTLIGLPIRTWLLDEPGRRTSAVPSAFVGVAVLQLVTWYWMDRTGDGARGLGRVLVGIGLVGSAISARRGWRALRRDPRRHLAPVLGGLGGAIVFVLAFSALFRVGFQTTASLENLDAPSYAEAARHLVEDGFDDPGHIAGTNLGSRLRVDAFGSSAVLGEAGDATGRAIFKLTMPCLFVFVVLGASSLARLLSELFRGRDVLAASAATAAMAGILPTYVAGQYFLGQVMAMALAPVLVLLALRATQPASRAARIRQVGAAASVLIVLLSHYSQMIVPIVAVLVPGVLLVNGVRDSLRAAVRVGIVLAGGAVVAIAAAPSWLDRAIDQSQAFSQITVGWPLPGFLPVDLLGFTSTVYNARSDVRIAGSVAIVAAVAAAVACLARRERGARWAGVCVALVLLSYAAVYEREGGASYRQWKWITFFQPAFAAAAVIVVGLALGVLVGRLPGGRERRWTMAVPAVVCLGVGLVAFLQSRQVYGSKLAGDRPYAYVDQGLAHLAGAPGLAGIDELNIDVAQGWDTMWAPYFLPDIDVHLQSAGYYPLTPPAPTWTLTQRTGDLGGPPYVPLTERFRLEAPFAGPTSAQREGLDARIAVESWSASVVDGGAVLAHVVVTNTGTASWLPTEAGDGGVYIGAHLATPTGEVTVIDFTRQALVPGWKRPIVPGGTVTLDLAIAGPPPGHHLLELQMVSEGVAWFGETTALTVDVEPVAVAG